jgi:hypothetical protein
LIEGSSGGRPGRRDRPLRPPVSSRCHRRSVSGQTKKLSHRSRERSRLAAARKERSAVVNRGRAPPRPRIFSWWRSMAASRSRSPTLHRDEKTEQTAEEPIPQRQENEPSLNCWWGCWRTTRSGRRSSFFTPQGRLDGQTPPAEWPISVISAALLPRGAAPCRVLGAPRGARIARPTSRS